jgi:predicted O-linked N-acetylglucosamine transferase (SPINDLY family)
LLIDRKGHTRGGRLGILASRPRTVQLHYMSFPGTLGYDAVDGIIADDVVIPIGQRGRVTTSDLAIAALLIRQTMDAARCLRLRAERCRLPEDALVLACFNQSYKLSFRCSRSG